jgi:hypothetical protein
MRHVLACILGVFSFGVVLAEKSEYAHWRWWFLAATSDSATIKLYDDVEQKYLTISDLRALRDDLEPHYRRLSDTIMSTSDAQMAALLIRLFHYSTARPYKTAVYTERIANKLASYLSGRVDTSVTMNQIIDLWTACDLGMNAMLSPDGYEAFLAIQDHQKTIGILTARFQVGGSDSLSRYRCFVQSIDGVTKHLEFNGIRDSAYAAALGRVLSNYFDSIDVNRRSHEDDDLWALLARFSKVMRMRVDDNRGWSSFAESASSHFTFATISQKSSAIPCFPEVRLRAQVASFMQRIPMATYDEVALAFNYQMYPQFMSLYAESVRPGFTETLLDSATLDEFVANAPVSYEFIQSERSKSALREGVARYIASYYECYRVLFPSLKQAPLPAETSHCNISEVLDNVMMDRYREYRTILVTNHQNVEGSTRIIVDRVSSRSFKKHVDRLSSKPVVRWALQTKWIASSYDDLAKVLVALIDIRYQESRDVSRSASPLNIGTYASNARMSLSRTFRDLCIVGAKTVTSDVLGSVFGGMLSERSRITGASRSNTMPTVETTSTIGRYPTKLKDFISGRLSKIFGEEHLAQYVSGEKNIDQEYLGVLAIMSDEIATHQRLLRHEYLIPAAADIPVWMPNDETIYIISDKYPSEVPSLDMTPVSSGLYKWFIHLVSADTITALWNIDDELVRTSIRSRQTSLSYGLNISTQLDSIIFKMLDDLKGATGKKYSHLVFLPVDILYAYNPIISHVNGRYLVEEYEVSVSTCLRAGASNAIDSIRLQIVKPGDSDLAYARSESEAICDLVRSRGGVASVLSKIENERDLSQQLESSTALHISSHASQANLVSDIEEQPLLRELMRRDDIGSLARAMRGPLIQYKSETRTSGPLYGDGFISPLEMEVYNVKVPKLMFLSTCQTTTQTSDHWEPPDGMIRVSFSRGAECVVTSPIAVPDRYAASYAIEFYDQLSRTKLPHKAANEIVRQGIKEGKSVREYGIYFPIYFSEE